MDSRLRGNDPWWGLDEGGFSSTSMPGRRFLLAPVDKPLDIHSVQCAELIYLYTGEFLSNNDPNWIQCFSG
jgi:hypothetical protein